MGGRLNGNAFVIHKQAGFRVTKVGKKFRAVTEQEQRFQWQLDSGMLTWWSSTRSPTGGISMCADLIDWDPSIRRIPSYLDISPTISLWFGSHFELSALVYSIFSSIIRFMFSDSSAKPSEKAMGEEGSRKCTPLLPVLKDFDCMY